MMLKIIKSQKKGLMGGPSFELRPELFMTDDEVRLIDHYGLQNQPLASTKVVSAFGGNPIESAVTFIKLTSGIIYKCKSLTEIIVCREQLIEACKNLKALLIAAASFEDTEEIDFDALLVDVEED